MNLFTRAFSRVARFVAGRPAETARAEPAQPSRTITRIIRARYDAAQTTDENRNHWVMADGLSPKTANTWYVRYQLRARARYEVANNSYAKGIILTLANDTIGTGPRIQVLTENDKVNRLVEKAFSRWCDAVCLAEKLHTMRQARAVDGEAFMILTHNPGIDDPVQLDVVIREADQVHTPALNPIDPYKVDGITFDEYYNPIYYHLLKFHPGDVFPQPWVFQLIPAKYMVHWFRADRPGEVRGVPEITSALPLFAQLRRYTLATLSAAETAANFAAVLQTQAPANPDEQEFGVPWEHLDIHRNTMTTLPAGTTMNQFEPQQPTGTYAEFKHELINEIARCLNMPFNIAAGNSSSYNYSSGRLDHQVYYKAIRIEQSRIEKHTLDKIFNAWLQEWILIQRLTEDSAEVILDLDQIPGYPHRWFWDGHGHVDPQKEADAQETRLRNYTTTLQDEYHKSGMDWKVAIKQRADELAYIDSLGMPPAGTSPLPPAEKPEDTGDQTDSPPGKNGKSPTKSNGKPDMSEQNGKPAKRSYPQFDKQNDREARY